MRTKNRIHSVNAPRRTNGERQIEAERLLLAALCQQTLPASIREETHQLLAKRKFAHAEHQLVFWALSELPAREPSMIRELLATRLTLMGFPDFDIDHLFDTPPPPEREIPALLEAL